MLQAFGIYLILCAVAVGYFDFKWLIVPNWLNLGIFAGGILYRLTQGVDETISAVLIAAAVAFCIWLVREIHRRIRGVVGLGLGDVKLCGAAAVWLPFFDLPLFLLFASLSALLYLVLAHRNQLGLSTLRLPFGPFLASSLVVTWGLGVAYGPLLGNIP